MSVLMLIPPVPNTINWSKQDGTARMNSAMEMLKSKQTLY